jgi:hypothetical protein
VVECERLGLVEFLADLRSDLAAAQAQALVRAEEARTAGDPVLWLGIGQVTVEVEVAHERAVSGETSGKVGGKFWVFASAEASVTAGGEWKRGNTQRLTLTLTPRVETTAVDPQTGQRTIATWGVDVQDKLAPDEQLPPPASSPS